MPFVSKFDGTTIHRILELTAYGHNMTEISDMLGFTRQSLHRFLKRHPKIKSRMDTIRAEYMADKIHKNIEQIADGVEIREITKEYLSEDDSGQPIKVTEKIRIVPPDLKANQAMASKYLPELSNGNITDSKGNAALPSIIINNSGMTLRELQSSAAIDAECVEVERSDNERGDSDSELVPPVKDSDDEV